MRIGSLEIRLRKKHTVTIDIDLEEDFDGIELETAIRELATGEFIRSRKIMKIIYNKWVEQIGRPEWKIS